MEETKEQLQRSREENIRGIMIRSRSLYYEQGERPTKYFLSLEKHNYVSKVINRLEIENKILTNPTEILLNQKLFYKRLQYILQK